MNKKIKSGSNVLIKLESLIIPPVGIHLLLKIKINNRVARLVIDTGASQSVLDISRITRFVTEKKFKKNDGFTSDLSNNNLLSHLVNVKKIQLDRLVLKNRQLILLDLTNVNQSYAMLKTKPVDGVLGGDLLNELNAVIDYRKKILRVRI